MPRLTSAELEVMQILWEHGALKPGDGLTAHPKICGRTGDLISNTQLWQPPYFTVQIFDKHGKHKKAIPIEMMAAANHSTFYHRHFLDYRE